MLAWVAVVLHVAYLSYQMFGGLLAFRHPRMIYPHLACVAWGIGIVVVQGQCPVTNLEKWLRRKDGEGMYTESFLDHYVFGTLLPNGTQALVYGLHLAFIVGVYVVLVTRYLRSSRADAAPVAASRRGSGMRR
jgi:hypothetical protein